MSGKLFTFAIDEDTKVRMAELAKRLTGQLREQINQLPRELAEATHAKAVELATLKLHTTKYEYIAALDFQQTAPGVWSVYLKESAAHLEEGYDRFDMKPGLLRNAKKKSKSGYAYRSIPMFNSDKGKLQAQGDNMLSDLKRLRAGLGDEGLSKDANGNPLLGKIFSITRNDVGVWQLNPNQTGVDAASQRFAEPPINDNLVGVTKYQFPVKSRNGRFQVKSQFVTFRTVSADPRYASKFWHPGFGGIHAFDELTKWAGEVLERRLKEVLG